MCVLNKKLLYMPPFVLLNDSGFHILVVVLCGCMHIIYNWQITKRFMESFWSLFLFAYLQETYLRRMATCLAAGYFSKLIAPCFSCFCISWQLDEYVKTCADGIVINVVVGGEVITLKNIEESSSLVIAEMPINVSLLHVPCSSINEFEIQGRKWVLTSNIKVQMMSHEANSFKLTCLDFDLFFFSFSPSELWIMELLSTFILWACH